MALKQTPSQTIGPYFAYGLIPEGYGHAGVAGPVLQDADAGASRIRLVGRVLDGNGAPVADALVEIWQADASGQYAPSNGFRSFGRVGTDRAGQFSFETIKPGRVPGRGNAWQAPHINIVVLARGMLGHVFTRLYFPEETSANDEDPVLATVAAPRRKTLIAEPAVGGDGNTYRFDIRLQGEDETVFFDV
jgi:protocatechuate 3,4-dioxygenase alpha subunit